MVASRDGACVVVRARESRAHGKGRQGTDKIPKTEEPPVASGDQADEAWLLSIQSKLYQCSRTNPDDRYGDLWNEVVEPHNLHSALRRLSQRKGNGPPGDDGYPRPN